MDSGGSQAIGKSDIGSRLAGAVGMEETMTKEIRRVDAERGICQCTTTDERWYTREEPDANTGLPSIVFRPSVTWICDLYPKGRGFENWLKRYGDEADQIARIAADRGYRVHRAIALLNEGETVGINDPIEGQSGAREPLTSDEYAGLLSYVDWWETEGRHQYKILKWEYTIWPNMQACAEKYNLPAELFHFAGTVDIKALRIADNTTGIIDCKTSLDIYPSHQMQVSAYRKAEGADWAALLQLNYRRNKTKKWKFTQVPDKFELFAATRKIWAEETAGVEPLQRDFPMSLTLSKSNS
jgi:hypothetical protein